MLCVIAGITLTGSALPQATTSNPQATTSNGLQELQELQDLAQHSQWRFCLHITPDMSQRVLDQVFQLGSEFFGSEEYVLQLDNKSWRCRQSREGKTTRVATYHEGEYRLDIVDGAFIIMPVGKLPSQFPSSAVLAKAPLLDALGIQFGNVVGRVGTAPVASVPAVSDPAGGFVAKEMQEFGGLRLPKVLIRRHSKTPSGRQDREGRVLFSEAIETLGVTGGCRDHVSHADPEAGRRVVDYRLSDESHHFVEYVQPASPAAHLAMMEDAIRRARRWPWTRIGWGAVVACGALALGYFASLKMVRRRA